MILMLAPTAGMAFGSAPSGAAYVADAFGLVKITNDSAADQVYLQGIGCFTLSPFGGWGTYGFTLLTDVYAADTASNLVLPGITGFPQHTTVSVNSDSGNTGTWCKTGTGHGSGNWTQISTLTISNLPDAVTAAQAGAATSTTQAGIATAAAAAAVGITASLSSTFTQGIGRGASGATVPINGAGAAGAGTYLWADPVVNAGPLSAVPFWAKVTGTYGVGVYTKSGTTVTKVASATFPVGVTGLKVATPADFGVINMPAGSYLAIDGPAGGLAYSTATTADGSGWWGALAGGSLPSTATVGAATTTQRLEGGFVASYSQQTVTAASLNALSASVAANGVTITTAQTQLAALRTKAVNTLRSYVLKTRKPTTAGSSATAGTTFVMNVVTTAGTINELEVATSGAGTGKLKFYTKSGSSYTLIGTINVTLASGYNYLKAANADFTALAVPAGAYIAFYSSSGIIVYASGGSDPAGYLQEAGDIGSFTDATAFGGTITPAIRVSIDSDSVFDQQAVSRAGVRLPAQVLMLIGAGQSLQAGQVTGTTTVSLYDNVGFPQGADASTAIDFLPLTAANCANAKESPILETPSGVKDLLLTENMLTYQQTDCAFLAGNVAVGGTTLAQNAFGSTIFTNAIAQITAASAISAKLLKSFLYAATIFKQGESDAGAATATYKTNFKQLADDYDTYGRAANGGQSFRPLFITYQTNSNAGTATTSVAQAQHEAAKEHPRIRLATPSYPCVFAPSDTQHPTADSTQWMGDFDALVIKREIHDKARWWHLHIQSASVSGATITLTYNPSSQLVLDTTIVPAQTNSGFSAADGGGSAVAISSVALLGHNRVRLTFASSGLAASVATVGYGQNAMTGRSDSFVGGGGNLRDNMGDAVKCRTRRMDRWAVVESFTL